MVFQFEGNLVFRTGFETGLPSLIVTLTGFDFHSRQASKHARNQCDCLRRGRGTPSSSLKNQTPATPPGALLLSAIQQSW